MTIEEAAKSLADHLNDAETFSIYTQNGIIMVNVNWIYRVPEVEPIKEWHGFPVQIGRRSCW
jgi:hypothetical protein